MSENEKEKEGVQRRDLLASFAGLAAGIAAAGLMPKSAGASTSPNEAPEQVRLQKPIHWNLISSDTNKDGAISESSASFELIGANGAKHVFEGYTRRVTSGSGHEDTVTMHVQHIDVEGTPKHSGMSVILTSVRYGTLNDGFRPDDVTVINIDPHGKKMSRKVTVKVPVPNPNAGLSDQELMDKILSEKLR